MCLCVHNPFGTETSGRSDTRPSLLLEKRDFILFCFPFSALPSSLHRTQHTSTRTADGCTLWKTREVAARGAVEMRGPRGLKLKKGGACVNTNCFLPVPRIPRWPRFRKTTKNNRKKRTQKSFTDPISSETVLNDPLPFLSIYCCFTAKGNRRVAQRSEPTNRLTD